MTASPLKTPIVFHDPDRRRWRWIRAVAYALALVLSVLVGVAVVSIIANPVLPAIGLKQIDGLPKTAHLPRPPLSAAGRLREADYRQAREALMVAQQAAGGIEPAALRATGPGYHSRLIGFYVNWDDASFQSLQTHIGGIDTLTPEWLHVSGPGSTISTDDPVAQAKAVAFIKTNRPRLQIVPLVNNYSQALQNWDNADLELALDSPAGRASLIADLLGWVRGNGFAGINIDFENLSPGSRSGLSAFMSELHARFHPFGLTVAESVPLNDPAFDYRSLSRHADYLVLMAYDEHASTSDPGPVASQKWFTDSVHARLADVPADKMVVGLGSYGYDWAAGQPAATPITFDQAIATAHAAGTTLAMDRASLNPYFDYTDAQGVPHHVWLLDAVTAFDQIASTAGSRPGGYAVWRLGAEDPTLWRVLKARDRLSRGVADTLEPLDVDNSVAYVGKGEILRVTGKPVHGGRELQFDPKLNLVTDEKVDKYAQPYVVTRWGGSDLKKIALTFDDGPDPTWTPKILDILDLNEAHATFFVVGVNADTQPGILHRIIDTGNEIGNHTYSHPDIAAIPPEQVKLQLDATDRLLQSRLGMRSVLFRPPYAQDVEPDTASRVRPLQTVSGLGYYTVAMHVDPNDWARPGSSTIVKRTVDQIVAGRGQVVLLHDGGGDRSQTVAALPGIIRELKKRGYQLVTVSDLVGLPRGAVMPPVPASQLAIASFNGAAFGLLDWATVGLYWLFITGVVLGVARFAFVGALAIAERIRDHSKRRRPFDPAFRPLVSAIVPCHNEEMVVVASVEALLASDYARFEVLVVDDGSTDATAAAARAAFAGDARVRVFTKPNGGKAAALEFGIERALGEIVIGMDADTLFRADAIGKLVRHFADPRVGAVAGNAKVGNRVNLLTRWQALEYITNQNLDRRAFDLLNCITVVPGAIGAWRRDLVIEAGGFTDDTLAEDADLTLRVLRLGYRIAYEDDAVAFTEAPDTVLGLAKQRHRWVFGTLQTFWKNRDAALRPKYGALGLVAMPNVMTFQVFFPLVSPLMDLMMITSLAGLWLQRVQHPLDFNMQAFDHVLFYYALFVALDFLTAIIAFALERDEDWSLLLWLFFQRFFYRQLMYYVVWRSVVSAVSGRLVGWHRVERKATVDADV